MKSICENKRGQFYLMATIIIIGIIISVLTISNYSFKQTHLNIYDFQEELKIEGEKVLDYETTTSDSKFDDFAKNYSEYAGDKKEIYFIVGRNNTLDVFRYNNGIKESQTYQKNGDNITVSINSNDYEFEIKEGENFHFIILEIIDGEQYVVTD